MKKRGKKRSTWWIILTVVLGLLLLIVLSFVLVPDNIYGGNVAYIPVKGVIMVENGGGGLLGGEVASSERIVDYIEEAAEDPYVEAILFDINSPGGSAVASDEIGQAIKRVDKPTIALVREVGASGGYWIASSTDHIVVNRMSIVGSIGVISSYLEFSRLLENYNITYQRMVAGKYKDMGTPFKELEDEEQEILQAKIDKIHDFFIDEISANRGIERSKVVEIATGEFFLGVEALELGLADELGGHEEAEKYLKEKLGLEYVEYVYYRSKPSLLEALSEITSPFFYYVGMGMGDTLFDTTNTLGIRI